MLCARALVMTARGWCSTVSTVGRAIAGSATGAIRPTATSGMHRFTPPVARQDAVGHECDHCERELYSTKSGR